MLRTLVRTLRVFLNRTLRTSLHSQEHHGLTDRRPIASRLNWPIRSITTVKYQQLTWYNSLWVWRWLPHRFSKRQSMSTTTVLFRTTFTRTIILNLLMKWLLGSNLSQLDFSFTTTRFYFFVYFKFLYFPWACTPLMKWLLGSNLSQLDFSFTTTRFYFFVYFKFLYFPWACTPHGSKCPVCALPFWALILSFPSFFFIMFVYFILSWFCLIKLEIIILIIN